MPRRDASAMEEDDPPIDEGRHVEKIATRDPPPRTRVVIFGEGGMVTFHRAKDAPDPGELLPPPGTAEYRVALSEWCDHESASAIDTLLGALQMCRSHADLRSVAEAVGLTNTDRAINRTVSFCRDAATIAKVVQLLSVMMAVVTVYDGTDLFGGPAYVNALLLNPVVRADAGLLRNTLAVMVNVLRHVDYGQIAGLIRTVVAANQLDDAVCHQTCRCADAVLRRASDACVDDFLDLHAAHALYAETCAFLEEITAAPLTDASAPCVLRAMTVLLFHDQLPPNARALVLRIAGTAALANERWDEVSAIAGGVGVSPDALREALSTNPHAAHLVVTE